MGVRGVLVYCSDFRPRKPMSPPAASGAVPSVSAPTGPGSRHLVRRFKFQN
jgi:hypothetical protein